MKKELRDFIKSLHWTSKEELEAFLKIIEERLKEQNGKIRKNTEV